MMRHQVDQDVYEAIQVLAGDLKKKATDIRRELEANSKYSGRVPEIRTMQRIVRNLQTLEEGLKPWRASDYKDHPEDARCVLDVLGAVIDRSNWPGSCITRAEARATVYLSKVAPGLKPLATFIASRWLSIARPLRIDPAPFDLFLALAPWRDIEAFLNYTKAVEAGKVPSLTNGTALLAEIGQNLLDELKDKLSEQRTASRTFLDFLTQEDLDRVTQQLESDQARRNDNG